ncbi:hypothetical protein EDD16DRAFT_1731685 [Pisolithus croceorrhizus]|nr:hypothetical protein EDD16DRAFT_1731685 [Pisolithus croceorrhizus]KAI6107496.1 hypothetical protein EV401DRAFT_2200081 [Pisolithus croceorrhizus]KAI6165542.1 hypothetical protein EDD17DRAFT_1894316 [Pisolithus thermaeus]
MEDVLSRLQGLCHPSRASASAVDNVPVHTTSADAVVAPCDDGCAHPTLVLFVSRSSDYRAIDPDAGVVFPSNRAQLEFDGASIHSTPCFVVRQQRDWMERFSDFIRAQFVTLRLVELVDDAPYALAVEYRLSSSYPFAEEHPFPTALLDALTGYDYLVGVMGDTVSRTPPLSVTLRVEISRSL